jgi:hypothetical protein
LSVLFSSSPSIQLNSSFYSSNTLKGTSIKWCNLLPPSPGILSLAGAVFAHPGHDVRAEAAERAFFLENAPVHQRSLAQCASKLKACGHENANFVRRANRVKAIRQKRGLQHSGFQSMYLHALKD